MGLERKTGDYKLYLHDFGSLRLDGGSMFGSVPREIWKTKIEPDEKNRILLSTNSLVVKAENRVFLIDCGNGDKWDEKSKAVYGFEYRPLTNPEEITDLILTHLHFDHAGGVSYYDSDKKLKLTYPNATVHLQKDNYANASKPNMKERASYLAENITVLDKANLNLLDGTCEIFPGIWVHRIDGHTIGQQYVEIRLPEETVFFASDLIPTSHHLPLPYHLGYDICALTSMRDKEELLEKVLLLDATVVFQHDSALKAAKVCLNKKGHYAVKQEVKLDLL